MALERINCTGGINPDAGPLSPRQGEWPGSQIIRIQECGDCGVSNQYSPFVDRAPATWVYD